MYTDTNGDHWYKGNLHTHSTMSDGAKTPAEVAFLYRKEGYDFLAFTDHWKQSETKRLDSGMLCLSGCEYDMGKDPETGIFHIVGIGMTSEPAIQKHAKENTPQNVIDRIHESGGIAIFAHPAWSLNTPEQILELKDIDGVEIYNTVSGVPWNCRPYSGMIIDQLGLHRCFLPCMAADDAHFYNGDECKSFLMVRAFECTSECILESLRNGDFFATQGPFFRSEVVGNELTIYCSPIVEAVFYDNICYSSDRTRRGDAITEIHYPLQPFHKFIRFELKDSNGRMAWSSPVSLVRTE